MSLWVIFHVDQNTGLLLTAITGFFTLYHSLLVPRCLGRPECFVWLRWINVGLEVSLPSLATVIDIILIGPLYALTSTPPMLVFLAVIASGLRTSRKLALFAGSLAAIEYLALYAAARSHPGASELLTLKSMNVFFATQHAMYLGLAGVFAATVALVGQRMTRRVVAQVVDNKRIGDLFGQYVSPEAAKRLTNASLKLDGEQRELTILFVDIRDFTPLAFQRSPEDVVQYLNSYFEKMVDIVVSQGGMLNKFMGDGLLAIFGAPEPLHDHSLRACQAGLLMAQVAAEIPRADGKPTRVGVGIHRGDVILGSIGAPARKDYTVIGDSVNLASRLESLTRALDVDVLVSQSVWDKVGDHFAGQSKGAHKVKGRDVEVEVYALQALPAEQELKKS